MNVSNALYLTQPVHKAVRQCPQAPAIVCGERRLTFTEFANRLSQLAAVLQQLGMGPGDRVGMLAFNSDRYVEYLYGVWWGGGVVNPVNIRWSAAEVAYSLDDCDTRILLVDDHHVALAQQLCELSASLQILVYVGSATVPEGMLGYEALLTQATPIVDALRSGDDLAAIMYTGGTTGQPKGVMLTHANMAVNGVSALAAVPRSQQAVVIHAAPMFHIGGIGLTVQLMLRLCKQIILPGFDETAVLRAISVEKGSEIFLVPAVLKRLLDCPQFSQHDLSSLRLVMYGAAAIDSTLLNQAIKALPQADFAQMYGMTELSPVVTCLPAWCHTVEGQKLGKLRSTGLPTSIAEIRIVDKHGADLPSGSVGEIIVRGPMVMTGYWNKPEQTAEALRDGWMHTGDGGYMDADGFIYVVDRIKDMVVTGGENVYSAEVENAILQMPEVALCAVIGVPDDKWGERVHAVLVLRAGAVLDAAAVTAHCKTVIGGYKCPRSIEFRDALPFSAAGKLLKYQLREPFWKDRDRNVN
jgi:acyl-CoA synthetase (AMP-forming)/AMP-acid ligase II